MSGSGSSASKDKPLPRDMNTKSQLTSLYNQPVVLAEYVNRPLERLPVSVGDISHSGVRVTLADGRTFLIHKGSNFGASSQTVVVDAKHMIGSWAVVRKMAVQGETVADFVRAGGAHYNVLFDNCHEGAGRMMQPKK
ncbi:uncharacterized protein LOC144827122 [Lissotriton helveticus]